MNKIRNAERRDAKNASLYYLYKCISKELLKFAVVPHAGTWIEINVCATTEYMRPVVPHAGTWIEIILALSSEHHTDGRSPRGNLD